MKRASWACFSCHMRQCLISVCCLLVFALSLITSSANANNDFGQGQLPTTDTRSRPGSCLKHLSSPCVSTDVEDQCKADSDCASGSKKCCQCSGGTFECVTPVAVEVTCTFQSTPYQIGSTRMEHSSDCTKTCTCHEVTGLGQWDCLCPTTQPPGTYPQNVGADCSQADCKINGGCVTHQKCYHVASCQKSVCVDDTQRQDGCNRTNKFLAVGERVLPIDSTLDAACNFCTCLQDGSLNCTAKATCDSTGAAPNGAVHTGAVHTGAVRIHSWLLLMIATAFAVLDCSV